MGERTKSAFAGSLARTPSRRRRAAGEAFARVRDSQGMDTPHFPDTDTGRELFRAAAELIAVAGRR